MSTYASLTEVLEQKSCISDRGISFITNEKETKYLSFGDLYQQSLKTLSYLQANGVNPEGELVFQVEDNESFIHIFWACLLGRIIPVPISVGNNDEHRLKLFKIWEILNQPHLMVNRKALGNLTKFASENNLKVMEQIEKRAIIIEDIEYNENPPRIHKSKPDDIAFIQFSSGSTGEPKGVVLTHGNLLTNIEAIIKGAQLSSEDSTLSWMPLTHDMGLIGFHLTPLVTGMKMQYIMPTSLFIRRPLLWLKMASQFQATILSSPNFGYKYFLSNFRASVTDDLDLSAVRLIFNGAEPISVELCNEFLEVMKKYHLKRSSIYPVYGMAEACLAVSFPTVGEEFRYYNLDRNFLNIGQMVCQTGALQTKNCVQFVDVGYPVDYCSVRICNDEAHSLGEGVIGYIHIKGKNVTQGYYNNPEQTRKTISSDGWLNTGDLGFILNGRLVITGRAKDIIFINGQNYYPQDIERVVSSLGEGNIGEAVACGIFDQVFQTESLLLFILFKKSIDDFVPIAKQIKKQIFEKTGLELPVVIPIKKIPKTTSGKVQRYKLTEAYQNGEFEDVCIELKKLLASEPTEEETSQDTLSEIEGRLLKICRETFNIEKIGIHDNFVEYGGNSLLLTRIQGELDKSFPCKVAITDLFKYSTIAKLAQFIQEKEVMTYEPIRLAPQYFDVMNIPGSGNVYSYNLSDELGDRLNAISQKENVPLTSILLSMYGYLLSKLSNLSKISIFSLKGLNLNLKVCSMDFTTINDFSSLFQKVKDEELGAGISLRQVGDMNEIMPRKICHSITPLFYESVGLNLEFEIFQNFDIILEVRKKNEAIHLLLRQNPTGLKEEKGKEIFSNYVKLIKELSVQYRY